MHRLILILPFIFTAISLTAQFAPAANQEGSTAIHKDDIRFVNWATDAIIERGEQNIADDSLNFAEAGESLLAVGVPDIQSLSLGDGGVATLTFDKPISNGEGPDFAIFENGFSTQDGYFLELAFVEVSSDGFNFTRFPATSLTDTSQQVMTFDLLDPTMLNNFAGKYIANFGTPFDLEELTNVSDLDISKITHVRIIDVIGSLADSLATFDHLGNKVNDPFPTPFPTGGFDLDAVGVIHENTTTNTRNLLLEKTLSIYPNPISKNEYLTIEIPHQLFKNSHLQLIGSNGNMVSNFAMSKDVLRIPSSQLSKGLYLLKIRNHEFSIVKKIVVLE